MDNINIWAVVLAAGASFLLGGLWYSKILFGSIWIRESGYVAAKSFHPARVFGVSFVLSLVGAFVFARFLGPAPELKQAVVQGLLVGAGFAGTSLGINYQFASRSVALLLIDAGYHTVQFGLYGMVLGMWH